MKITIQLSAESERIEIEEGEDTIDAWFWFESPSRYSRAERARIEELTRRVEDALEEYLEAGQ